MMAMNVPQSCIKCKKQRNLLIWCEKCGKFYCSACFKEYEVLRTEEQHPHSYAELLGQQHV